MTKSFTIKYKWDSIGTIKKLIEQWQPINCESEKDYEDSLLDYFQLCLPGVSISAQYGFGRAKADIVIGDYFAIEIKKDLVAMSEYSRLIGQMEMFNKWNGYYFVLLVGKTDKTFALDLKKYAKKISPLVPLLFEDKFQIITK